MQALERLDHAENDTYQGPARVSKIAAGRVELEVFGRRQPARSALGYPYRLVEGDTVLAIGQPGGWYVIGVLEGRGEMSFTAPGDIEFRAPNGRIALLSGEEIELAGPAVKIRSGSLELIAKSIVEHCDSARRWVRDGLELRAGRIKTVVEETYRLRAKRIVGRARDEVKIDGRQIRLG